jgi:hypothetical protein
MSFNLCLKAGLITLNGEYCNTNSRLLLMALLVQSVLFTIFHHFPVALVHYCGITVANVEV